MARNVKRVPLGFDWPVGKTWAGYLISRCIDNCDDCRRAAKLRGQPFTKHDCPDFESMVGPPIGEGWQMWEDSSEGSPISPVFETPESLARWLTDTNASAFAGESATYDQWLRMINHGSSVSAVMIDGKFINGVAALEIKND